MTLWDERVTAAARELADYHVSNDPTDREVVAMAERALAAADAADTGVSVRDTGIRSTASEHDDELKEAFMLLEPDERQFLIRAALESVLPDIERPLREEIQRCDREIAKMKNERADLEEQVRIRACLLSKVEIEALRNALMYLADPESWLGNPHDQASTLHGHFTPYELARAALGIATEQRSDEEVDA